MSLNIDMNIILSTPGAHGQFITWLFDCYQTGKISNKLPFNENGNAHRREGGSTLWLDVVLYKDKRPWEQVDSPDQKIYCTLWDKIHDFFYIVQAYSDRGASLKKNGIELMEKNLQEYEKQFGVPVFISDVLKKHFNYEVKNNTSVPRRILRDYWLLTFFTYFEHCCWQENLYLKEKSATTFYLEEIWNYETLRSKMNNIFKIDLAFENIHKIFIERNLPLTQRKRCDIILDAIDKENDIAINGLNVISEAYIYYRLECKLFDIPFLSTDYFPKTTGEIIKYIKHFPEHMKKPNNLFFKYYNYYNRGSHVDL